MFGGGGFVGCGLICLWFGFVVVFVVSCMLMSLLLGFDMNVFGYVFLVGFVYVFGLVGMLVVMVVLFFVGLLWLIGIGWW